MRSISLFALALAAACASGSSSSSTATTASPTPAGAPTTARRQYMATLGATGTTSSKLSGTITIVPLDAMTYSVSMDIRNGPKSSQVPWAIRPGPCGDMTPNSEIGGRGPYSAISTQADGSAHVNTRVRVEIPDGALHVDVMQSNSQRDVVLSCGQLAPR